MQTLELGEFLEDVERELDRVVEGSIRRLAVELGRVEESPHTLEVGGGAFEERMRHGQLATGGAVEGGLSRQRRGTCPVPDRENVVAVRRQRPASAVR